VLTQSFAYQTYRWKSALRVAIAAAFAAWLVSVLHWSNGFMAILVITVIPTVFPHAMFSKALERWLGAVCAVGLCWAVMTFIHGWLAITVILFLCMCVAGYLFALEKLGYACVIFAVTLGVMYFQLYTSPHKALTFGFDWVSMMALGLLLLFFAAVFIFPKAATQSLTEHWREFCESIIAFSHTGQAPRLRFRHQVTQLEKLLAASQSTLSKTQHAAYTAHIPKLLRLIQLWRAFYEYYHAVPEALRSASKIEPLLQQWQIVIQSVLEQWIKDPSHTPKQIDQKSLHSLIHTLQAFRQQRKLLKHHSVDDIYETVECFMLLKQIALWLQHVNDPAVGQAKHEAFTWWHGMSWVRAFKIALAIFATTWVGTTMGWPGGLQPTITATVIAVQAHIGAAFRQTWYRFVGVCAGAIAAVLAAICLSQLPYLWFLMLIYFAGLSVATYLGLGSKRLSYAGLQAGVALTLVLVISDGPTASNLGLQILGERVIGVFEGFLVALFVIMLIAPEDPVKRYRKVLGSGFDTIAAFYDGLFYTQKFHKEIPNIHQQVNLLNDYLFDLSFMSLWVKRSKLLSQYVSQAQVRLLIQAQGLLETRKTLESLDDGIKNQITPYIQTLTNHCTQFARFSERFRDKKPLIQIQQDSEKTMLQLHHLMEAFHVKHTTRALNAEQVVAVINLLLSLTISFKILQRITKKVLHD